MWKNKLADVDSTGPDNAWFIAMHPKLEFEDGSVHLTYVIAIAGTPPKSVFAWGVEDFGVGSVVNFSSWVASGFPDPLTTISILDFIPGEAYISRGTATGLYALLTVPAPEGAVSAGTTLLDFVTNLDKSASPRFITTGHSLGGALSPSLALTLVTAGTIPADLALTYPSAGASPGDTNFADLFAKTFPARPSNQPGSYKSWNRNLVNTRDMVPQAWCNQKSLSSEQNLENIPTLYGLPVVPLVGGLTLMIIAKTLLLGVMYMPIPSQYFTGPAPATVPLTLIEFMQTAGVQHVQYYVKEVGIPMPKLSESLKLSHGLLEKGENEKLFDYPLLGAFQWARENPEEAQKAIEKVKGTEEANDFLTGWLTQCQ